MRLAEGRGRERSFVDRGEGALQRHPELCFRADAHLRELDRGHLILQALELFRDLRWQDVEARRHELPHLDHEAAEVDREHVEARRDALQLRDRCFPPLLGVRPVK